MTQRIITDADKDAAKRLRAIWESKKQELKLTQVTVADEIGTSQSAISQYLNGTIALNTDAVLVFAKLLQCEPKDIRPVLGRKLKIKQIPTRRIPVVKSSTGAVLDKHIEAKYIGETSDQVYAVLIDEQSYHPRIKQGEYVVVDPAADITPGDEVLIETIDSEYIIKTYIREVAQGYAVENILTEYSSVIAHDDIVAIHPIIAVQRAKL
jgi:SOS-response transcriptional repressor LexA